MDVRILPRTLSGAVRAVTSKSSAHRLLILAAVADSPTEVVISDRSEDIDATLDCLRALGAGIRETERGLYIEPVKSVPASPLLDCRESGSTLRFILPLAAAISGHADFIGRGRLPQRPLDDLIDVMCRHGVTFSRRNLPFETTGKMSGGDFSLPGNISSQYITGLLLAMAAMDCGGTVRLTTALESSAYVDITISALRSFGIETVVSSGTYTIKHGQKCSSPGTVTADGDWSNTAFFLAAGALSGAVTVTGIDRSSPQGDKRIVDILRKFGAAAEWRDDSVTVTSAPLKGCEINVSEVPDLLPVLSIVAANASGDTVFTGGSRLRLKESDRLAASAQMLRALGGSASETTDGLIVHGGCLMGGTVDSFHDHRIVMSAAVAAVRCSGNVVITDAGAVNKSYPNFFRDYNMLGGEAHVI